MTNLPKLDDKSTKWLPWLVAMSFFMQMLDGTILNTALPAISRSFNENPLRMQMVLISYILTCAICIPLSGWLTDRFGPRRLMSFSIALFTFGSLVCAISFNLPTMVSGRVMQGIGGALMVPVGRLVILRLYPRDQLVRVLSIIPVPGLFGALIGPALGGMLVEYASWHWIFFINLPVGVLGIIITMRLMPEFELEKNKRFDLVGFVMFGTSLILISLSLELIGHGFDHLLLAFTLAILGLSTQLIYWLKYSIAPHALFQRTIFKVTTFKLGLLGNIFGRLGSGATPFLMPLLLQVVLGYSPLISGLLMMPMAFASVLAKFITRRLANRFQYRTILITNTLLQGALIISLATIGMDMKFAIFCFQVGLLGFINSIQFSFLNTYTLMDLSWEDSGGGNALLSVTMQLSQSLAVGMAAALLILFHGNASPDLDPQYLSGTLRAFHYTFIVVGLSSVIATIIFIKAPKK